MLVLLFLCTVLLWMALLLLIAVGTRISTQLWRLYTIGHMESNRQKIVQPVS
jgi:hypothetical protein